MRRAALPILTVLAGIVSLAATAKTPSPIGSPGSALPPCYVPSGVDTTGWQTVRMFSRPVTFRLPPTLKRRPHSIEGVASWFSDGHRFFNQYLTSTAAMGWASDAPEGSGYSECVDTLGGVPFRICTLYDWHGHLYRGAAATFGDRFEAMMWGSPDSADQRLFLAIIRTLRADSTSQSGGPSH